MISALKSTLNLNNLKILRPKATKNLKDMCKKFCESPPSFTGNESEKFVGKNCTRVSA